MPPQSHPHGASYGQWAARWWQWLCDTSVSISPEFSAARTPDAPVPVACDAGQSGNVWFLGGTYLPTSTTSQGKVEEDNVYRTCAVPVATFLFFPLVNDEFDNLGCPNATWSADQLKTAAATEIDDIVAGALSATIDGASVSGLFGPNTTYRAPSPWFSYTLPPNNVGQFFACNFPAGTCRQRRAVVPTGSM